MRTPGLPARRLRLIGRDNDVAAVQELALHGDGRLVTLVGVGGVGKTTLALEVGRGLAPSMPDGAWFVDLAPIAATDDPADLVLACCTALGLVELGRPPADVLVAHLEPRQALLILDNCEHVRTAVGALVDGLLDACPYLSVLATSRAPLRVAGETVFRVAPMPVPDPLVEADPAALAAVASVELFVRRAKAAQPAFELDDSNAAGVAGICRRLDGLPLAIELAAAHVGALEPAEIETRLGHERGLLDADTAGGPDRQRTMEATLEWSYRLLSETEQTLFRRLSVFARGWTLAAAEAVCSLDGEAGSIAAVLASLVDQSLVVRAGHGKGARFTLLEPIAEFAARRLDTAGEGAVVALPHAQYYLALAGRRAPGALYAGPEDLDRIAADYENCLAAIRHAEAAGIGPLMLGFAVALAGYWRIRGHLYAGAEHLALALGSAGDAPSPGRELALIVLADFERLLGRHDAATQHASDGIAVADVLGDVIAKRTAIAILGDIAAAQGDLATAHARYEEAWEFIEALPHPFPIGLWHANMGVISLREGSVEAAQDHLERALVALGETAPTWYTGRALAWLGAVERRRGDLALAQRHLTDGFAELLRYGARVDAIGCLEDLARVALDGGDPGRGATLLAAARALRDATAVPPDDVDRVALVADIDRAREGQPRDAFAAAWGRGREMSFEEAARFASAPPRPAASAATAADRPPRGSELTRREREVAELVARGLTNPQIAEQLFISPGTVRSHVEQILGKLGLTSRVQVATWIVGSGSGHEGETGA